jgi:molecular chaperone Hsp33
MSDLLVRGIDRAAGLRVVVAVTTDLVREAARRHGAEGLGACALGRALTSSLLLATLTKGDERVTLQLQGDGPVGGITADATAGEVRGYLTHADRARRPCDGRGRVVEVLGRHGVVNVLRDLGLKERYQGQIALITGEVDEDVEGYLRTSEQVPSALGCDVVVEGGEVIAAAGVLVQALPEEIAGHAASMPSEPRGESPVRAAQHALRIGVLWEALQRGGASPRQLAETIYGGPLEFLDERQLRFACRCSRDKVEESMTLLGTVDLDEMIAEDGQAEVTCNFCNTRYLIDREGLERIRDVVAKGPRERN